MKKPIFFSIILNLVFSSTSAYAMNELQRIALDTFGAGKPGSIIIKLALLAYVVQIMAWISELKSGHYSMLIQTSGKYVGIAMVVTLIWSIFKDIMVALGLM